MADGRHAQGDMQKVTCSRQHAKGDMHKACSLDVLIKLAEQQYRLARSQPPVIVSTCLTAPNPLGASALSRISPLADGVGLHALAGRLRLTGTKPTLPVLPWSECFSFL